MNKLLAVIFLFGILIGVIVGYGFFAFLSGDGSVAGTKSWHSLTDFIVFSDSPHLTGVNIAYSYSNVYDSISPNFTVKTDFWRARIETVPYFNYSGKYIAYYAPIPFTIKVIRPAPLNIFGFMTMLLPSDHNVTTTYWHYQNESISYALPEKEYVPVRAVYTFEGTGIYKILMAGGTGCFRFQIEEYY
jgi:hypothetical protein